MGIFKHLFLCNTLPATMLLKYFVPIFVLCLVHSSKCKPTENFLTQGRGLGSTLWEWITYPFSWWGSSDLEQMPVNDQLAGPAQYGPYDNIEIAKRNVTVWCNDHTCTTMKCDKFGCKNITCNIYDTDLRGECREYNTELKPEEPVPPKPIHTTTTDRTSQDKVSSAEILTATTAVTISTQTSSPNKPAIVEERPIELEAVLSSTVIESTLEKESTDTKGKKSSSVHNKV